MSRYAYVNGRYVPHNAAAVHIEDRGYQFADAVYEVCEIRDGYLVDETRHLDRLGRSLRELQIVPPMARRAMSAVMRTLIRKNRVTNGLIYLQVSRGVAPRDHAFPSGAVVPAVVMTAKSVDRAKAEAAARKGVKVVTVPNTRWSRVDVKSVSLLPNVLAKQAAYEQGAKEAWFVDDDGYVLEGSSTNAWIVTKDNVLVTRHADTSILKGITRTVVMDLLESEGIGFEERPFHLDEAYQAQEAFISSASSLVMPVIQINEVQIGTVRPGTLAPKIRSLYHSKSELSPLTTRLADTIDW